MQSVSKRRFPSGLALSFMWNIAHFYYYGDIFIIKLTNLISIFLPPCSPHLKPVHYSFVVLPETRTVKLASGRLETEARSMSLLFAVGAEQNAVNKLH